MKIFSRLSLISTYTDVWYPIFLCRMNIFSISLKMCFKHSNIHKTPQYINTNRKYAFIYFIIKTTQQEWNYEIRNSSYGIQMSNMIHETASHPPFINNFRPPSIDGWLTFHELIRLEKLIHRKIENL